MSRRRYGIVVACAALLLAAGYGLAACGGDDGGTTEATTTLVTTPPLTTTTTVVPSPPLGTTTTVVTMPTVETTTPATTPTLAAEVVEIVVVNGAPEGGIVRRTVEKGGRVVLVVRSDVADEVHLHGYDVSKDVAVGGTVRITFTATAPGRFEVELEDRGVQIAELTVEP